jgi:rubrerythrin
MTICKSCGTSFYDSQDKAHLNLSFTEGHTIAREEEEGEIWECAECGSEILEYDKACPKCGVVFEEDRHLD